MPAKDGAPAYFRLKTQHYVTLGSNLVEEYQRGQRTATCILKTPADKKEDITLKIELALFDDDPPVKKSASLDAGVVQTPLAILKRSVQKKEEMAAVLDTGQRDEFMPPMTNAVQAQSEYITFGRPAGAGGVRRTWALYSLETVLPRASLISLASTKKAQLRIRVGETWAVFTIDGDSRKAWLRLVAGEPG